MVIVAAMRLQRWVPICRAFNVIVPAIIAGETQFFDDHEGQRVYVDLRAAPTAGRHRFTVRSSAAAATAVPDPVANGEFTLWQASGPEFLKTRDLLHPELSARVDAGEQEAVTYLRLAADPDTILFATADAGAILATVAFGFSACPVSLEAVLKSCGQKVALSEEFCDSHVKECVRLGQQRVVTGRALAPPAIAKARKKRP